jgi:hypothetical protein
MDLSVSTSLEENNEADGGFHEQQQQRDIHFKPGTPPPSTPIRAQALRFDPLRLAPPTAYELGLTRGEPSPHKRVCSNISGCRKFTRSEALFSSSSAFIHNFEFIENSQHHSVAAGIHSLCIPCLRHHSISLFLIFPLNFPTFSTNWAFGSHFTFLLFLLHVPFSHLPFSF